MPPNVLIVVFDAARRDAFEPYGAATGSTPTVSQLGSRGKAHVGVHATAPWTVPSHTSMFTGLMPRAAGLSRVTSPADVSAPLFNHRPRLLADVLKRAGYTTGAASANLWLSPTTGFDFGFEEFAEIDTDRNAQLHLDSLRQRLRWYLEALQARADDGARQVESRLEHWAADSSRRPFFWFVNLLECHSPFLPPRPYGGGSPVARVRAAADARRHYTLGGFWRACAGVEDVPRGVLERGRRLYAASIRYMDDWLGRILETLDAQDVLEETLVLVLSDHGENFGEDGLIGHGLSLDERLLHVPFVAAGPGAEDMELVSLADLPLAIAEACGVEDHPWARRPMPDLATAQFDPPVVVGDEENMDKLRGIGIDGSALEKFVTPLTCAIDGDLKLLRRGSEEVLFDLARDPGEQMPLTAEQAGESIQARLPRLRSALEFGSEPVAADTSAPQSAPSEEELRDLEERMKLLGYM